MSTYIIQGNINFNEELFKMLDEDSDNENDDELCLITKLPLVDKYITLDCNHKFNYIPLLTELRNLNIEICKQKYNNNLKPIIQCPYCRHIQHHILPYYKELNVPRINGINTRYNNNINVMSINPITYKGVLFKPGTICDFVECILHEEHPSYDSTYTKLVATIPNTSLTFCKEHFFIELKKHNKNLKQKEKVNKIIEQFNTKKQLLDEHNSERIKKGLKPLKRLLKTHLNSNTSLNSNVVQQTGNPIDIYNPTENNIITCKAILKSGINKGLQCSCKKIYKSHFCKRHFDNSVNNTFTDNDNVI